MTKEIAKEIVRKEFMKLQLSDNLTAGDRLAMEHFESTLCFGTALCLITLAKEILG